MRRRVAMSIAVVLVFAGSAFSQNGMDIFGGYSYQRTGGEGVNGFNASVTGNVAPWVGLTAEFGLHTKGATIVVPNPAVVVNADAKLMAFRFGPKFVSHVNDSTDLFVHVLAGAYRASASVDATGLTNMNVNSSGTGFTAATGGGVDLRVAPRIAVRPVQIDWIHLGSASVFGVDMGHSNGFRYSGGLVVRF
jgi:hypothetical protein